MLPLTRHGTREMIVGTIVLLVLGALLGWIWWPLSLLVWPVIIWLFAFFRDPERPIPATPDIMVSPADGMVSDVEELSNNELLSGPCLRIGIFLNVFNVHVNRSPCEGTVTQLIYKKGKFINAMSHNAASSDNESNTIVISDPTGRPVAVVKQIVGLIARRIICDANIGTAYARGERIGMIKFGSRTELYIPMHLGPKSAVKVGQKIRGGMDVIATLSPGNAPAGSGATAAAATAGAPTGDSADTSTGAIA